MKVLIIPRGANPYQELLYSELRNKHSSDRFSYLNTSIISFPFYFIIFSWKRLQGYNVIHIHWLIFHISHKFPLAKRVSYYYTIFCIWSIKLLGYKLVWTVHETTTHDNWTINDVGISRYLSQYSDAKIIHSRHTLDQMNELKMSTVNSKVIPIGAYNIYPNKISREQARKKLNLSKDEFVILFFGIIRTYKGVEDLIDVFKSLDFENTRLVIAGKCREEAIANKINRLIKDNAQIDFYDFFIPDEDVATYFKACDIVCLPFKKITTSSSVLLAMGFKKPVIAPYIEAIREIPRNTGFFYNPNVNNALKTSIKNAIAHKHKLTNMGQTAYNYSQSLSWGKIAQDTYALYQEILSQDGEVNS
jgi:beta-1,4-mannosyltransferase